MENPPGQVHPREREAQPKTLAEYAGRNLEEEEDISVWDRFQLGISDTELYGEHSSVIEKVLSKMADLKIVSIVQKDGGTQFKLIVDFKGGGQALFKPMRFPREQVRKVKASGAKFKRS